MNWRQLVKILQQQLAVKDEITKTQAEQIKTQAEQIRLMQQQSIAKDAIIQTQEGKLKLLEQHVLHLENKLRKYINENTPSSKKPEWDKKSPDRTNKKKKPLGKPVGSNGATRPTPQIDKEEVVRLEQYENYLGMPIDYEQRVVGDIPPPGRVWWTRYWLAHYTSPATGSVITATHPDCPAEGTFGPNLRALITVLRERARISEGQVAEFLNTMYGLNLASGTIEAELGRAAAVLQPCYDAIGSAVNDALVKHSDETGQSLNGHVWCVYCFSTFNLTYFFSGEKKRAEHVRQRLTDNGSKVLVCDGHSIYEWWSVKQRCWAHPIRKEVWLLDEKKTEERQLLHEAISGTYHKSMELLKEKPAGPEQLWNVLLLRNRLWRMLHYAWKDEKCQKVAQYMKNGWGCWFVFMLVPGVEPTNNLNERDVRKHVMRRKVSGAFRSAEGLKVHCVLLSVLESWRKNNRNIYTELVNAFKRDNENIQWAA